MVWGGLAPQAYTVTLLRALLGGVPNPVVDLAEFYNCTMAEDGTITEGFKGPLVRDSLSSTSGTRLNLHFSFPTNNEGLWGSAAHACACSQWIIRGWSESFRSWWNPRTWTFGGNT